MLQSYEHIFYVCLFGISMLYKQSRSILYVIRKLINFQEKIVGIIWKHKYKTEVVDVFFFIQDYFRALYPLEV